MIEIKLDYEGNPYLELIVETMGQTAEDKILEVFIRKSKEKGVIFINESSFETSDHYASIRIKGCEEK